MDKQFTHHLEKLKKRLHNSRLIVSGTIDKVIEKLSSFEESAENLTDDEFQKSIFSIFEEIKQLEPLKKVCSEHRESYSFIGRLGKEIDNLFVNDLEDLNAHHAEPLDSSQLDTVLSEYLLSQGLFDQANLISPSFCMQKEKISKITEMIKCLEQENYELALKIVENIGNPSKQVLFSIHKLKFISLLKKGNTIDSINYARNNLQIFANTHLEEIKNLMGSSVFVSNPEDSPYAEFFTEKYTNDTIKDIFKEFSKSNELPWLNSLETVIQAGETVIPELIPLAQIAGNKF